MGGPRCEMRVARPPRGLAALPSHHHHRRRSTTRRSRDARRGPRSAELLLRASGPQRPRASGRSRPFAGGTRVVTRALVNVDFGPAMILGSGMVASGLALYQVRVVRPEVSKDYDIMFASVALLCGGILIFQGWRLDPLLLFGQILTAAAAATFAAEAVNLRGQVRDEMQARLEREGGSLPGEDALRGDERNGAAADGGGYYGTADDRFYDNEESEPYYSYSGYGAEAGRERGRRGAQGGGRRGSDGGYRPEEDLDRQQRSRGGDFVEFESESGDFDFDGDGDGEGFDIFDVNSDWE